ncbi:hypothetical protein ACQ0P8_06375 [Halodesulfovibrio aestuarii]|uniref:hypothetical protein n=1 Tax=Halodesulfovibrio aestuarii TaxID=126333 RepID=UPI003D310B71
MTIVRSAFLEYSYIALIILGEIDVFSDFKFRSFVLNFIKKNFVWVLVGLGLAPLCFLIYYYFVDGYVKFDPILKSDVIDWASVGSMAAGCFTGMAAFFTLGSLVFLRQQHVELLKTQQVKDDEQKRFYIDQRKHWERESELNILEKYHKHKQLFIEALLNSEKRTQMDMVIKDKELLYAKVFPNNTPCSFSLTSELGEDKAKPTYLVKAKRIYNQCEKMVSELDSLYHEGYIKSTPEIKQAVHSLCLTIASLREVLGVNINENTAGSVRIDYPIGFNIFSVGRSFDDYALLINTLLEQYGDRVEQMPNTQKKTLACCFAFFENINPNRDIYYEVTLTRDLVTVLENIIPIIVAIDSVQDPKGKKALNKIEMCFSRQDVSDFIYSSSFHECLDSGISTLPRETLDLILENIESLKECFGRQKIMAALA